MADEKDGGKDAERKRQEDALRVDQIIRTLTQARAELWGRMPGEAERARNLVQRVWQAMLEKDGTTKVRLDVLREAFERAEGMNAVNDNRPLDAAGRAFIVRALIRQSLSDADPPLSLVQQAVDLRPSKPGVWAALGKLARSIGIDAKDTSLKAMWQAKPR